MGNNCYSCANCWRDDSVGYRECTVADKFDNEEDIVKYYEDAEDGCPHYSEAVDAF